MSRRYLKVADAMCGIGWSRGYWTKAGLRRAGLDLSMEFAPAVWVYTPKEKAAYDRGIDSPGQKFSEWLVSEVN